MATETPFILASASPRRLSLLDQIGVKPDLVLPADIDESVLKDELPKAYALRVATAKLEAVRGDHPAQEPGVGMCWVFPQYGQTGLVGSARIAGGERRLRGAVLLLDGG